MSDMLIELLDTDEPNSAYSLALFKAVADAIRDGVENIIISPQDFKKALDVVFQHGHQSLICHRCGDYVPYCDYRRDEVYLPSRKDS